MGGRSDEEVLAERAYIQDVVTRNYFPTDCEFIDLCLGDCNEGPVWCLGESIKLLQDADCAIFAPGWDKARGCRIEYQVCKDYGIDIWEL